MMNQQHPHLPHSRYGPILKRTQSESDSEDGCRSSEVTGSGIGPNNRKRRRGIIEKRRRDRINTSLSELKKLVPSALEKSGSAKLEKAEILQMTVEHLKYLQNNPSTPSGPYEQQQKYEYQAMGIRECAAEASRYLITVEGLDAQDPLRLRLSSHLQMYAAQRASTAPIVGNHHHQQHQQFQISHQNWNYNYNYVLPAPEPKDPETNIPSNDVYGTGSQPPHTSDSSSSIPHQYYNGYPQHSSSAGITTTTTAALQHPIPSSTSVNYGKPYRPWGAEMAC